MLYFVNDLSESIDTISMILLKKIWSEAQKFIFYIRTSDHSDSSEIPCPWEFIHHTGFRDTLRSTKLSFPEMFITESNQLGILLLITESCANSQLFPILAQTKYHI